MSRLRATAAALALGVSVAAACSTSPKTVDLGLAAGDNASGDASLAWFGGALRMVLADALSHVPQVVVRSRHDASDRAWTQRWTALDREDPVQTLARASEAGLDAVIFSRLEKIGSARYRLRLRAVNPDDGSLRWHRGLVASTPGGLFAALPSALLDLFAELRLPLGDGTRARIVAATSGGAAAWQRLGPQLATIAPLDRAGEAGASEGLAAATALGAELRAGETPPSLWNALGWAQRMLAAPAATAEASFDAALKLAPSHVPALFGRGLCRLDDERYEAALADLARVVALSPRYAPHRRALMEAQRRAGLAATDPTRRLEHMQAAETLAAGLDAAARAAVRRSRVEVLADAGRYREALIDLDEVRRHIEQQADRRSLGSVVWQLDRQRWELLARLGLTPQGSAPELTVATDWVGAADGLAQRLTRDPDRVAARDCGGATLLHLAAGEGAEHLLEVLLSAGAEPRSRTATGESPLHRAAWAGHRRLVSRLLDAGAGADARDHFNRTPLHRALWGGHAQVVELLLSRGADPDASNGAFESAVFEAVRHGHAVLIPVLAGAGATIDHRAVGGMTASMLAAGRGDDASVAALLAAGGAVTVADFHQRTVLHHAARAGAEAVVRRLLAAGAAIAAADSHGRTPLHAAADADAESVAALLMEAGAALETPDAQERTPLHLAAHSAGAATLTLLLDGGALLEARDAAGHTPLALAAEGGNAVAVELLLRRGADPGATNARGASALELAAAGGHGAVVGLLARARADQPGRADDLERAMVAAVAAGQPEVVRLLVELGAALNRPGSADSPLLVAVRQGQAGVMEALVSLGADPALTDAAGRNALHLAAEAGFVSLIDALNAAGAPLEAVDARRYTPLHAAVAAGRVDSATALAALGANLDTEAAPMAPVHTAMLAGARFMVTRLVSLGASEDLYVAAWLGRVERVRRLAGGRALRRLGPGGMSALHQAVRGGDKATVALLLRRGAPVDLATGASASLVGVTPLMLALSLGESEIAKLLIARGANPALTDALGNSGFDYLGQLGRVEERLEVFGRFRRSQQRASGLDEETLVALQALPRDDGESVPPAEVAGDFDDLPPTAAGLAVAMRESWAELDLLQREELPLASHAHRDAETGLEQIAVACLERRRLWESERSLRDLLAVRQKWHDEGAPEIALANHNLARTLFYLQRYPEATRRYAAALQIIEPRKSAPGWRRIASVLLDHLGQLHATRGAYLEAERAYLDALALRDLPSQHFAALVAVSHSNLGELYVAMGRYGDAEERLREALTLRQRIHFEGARPIAISQNNLAVLLDRLGDHRAASAMYRAQLKTFHQSLELAELGRAEPVRLDELAIAHHNVALVELREGALAAARRHASEALKRLGEAGADGRYVLGRVQLGLAAVQRASGEPDKAAHSLRAALKSLKLTHGELHALVATARRRLGTLALQRGDLEAARRHLEEALAIVHLASAPDETWRTLHAWSEFLAAAGKTRAAVLFGKRAVNALQSLRAETRGLAEALQRSFIEERASVYRDLADRLIQLGRLPEASQVLAMLKDEELRSFAVRSASLDRPVASRTEPVPSETPWQARYQQIRDELSAIGAELAALLAKRREVGLSEAEKQRVRALREDVRAGRRAFDAYLDSLLADAMELAPTRIAEISEKNLQRVRSLQGTLRNLGHGAVLVHYLVGADRLHILLTTPEVQIARDSEVSAAALNRRIALFREALQDPGADPRPLARDLYDLILGPIERDLADARATTLMVSLDGALRYVPLEALHDGRRFVVERYRVALFTEAARDKIKDRPGEDWRLAGLGLSKARDGMAALPAVPIELEGIVKREGADRDGVIEGVVHLDEAFTPEALQGVLDDDFQAVHIASHFVFQPGTDADSYLLMGSGERLSLEQIRYEGYSFDDVDLLTLSACNTAVGGGEGREIEGFAAMTQNLGAKGVLATLWPVADASTGEFMKTMYQIHQADAELTKADAIRLAKLGFIRGEVRPDPSTLSPRGHAPIDEPDPGPENRGPAPPAARYAHPYYWAPFILMGNWL